MPAPAMNSAVSRPWKSSNRTARLVVKSVGFLLALAAGVWRPSPTLRRTLTILQPRLQDPQPSLRGTHSNSDHLQVERGMHLRRA
jgi:hypothetical protein